MYVYTIECITYLHCITQKEGVTSAQEGGSCVTWLAIYILNVITVRLNRLFGSSFQFISAFRLWCYNEMHKYQKALSVFLLLRINIEY